MRKFLLALPWMLIPLSAYAGYREGVNRMEFEAIRRGYAERTADGFTWFEREGELPFEKIFRERGLKHPRLEG